jgi:hypothetical protein
MSAGEADTRRKMSKEAAVHDHKAAEHPREAAKRREAGDHDVAAQRAHSAQAHDGHKSNGAGR